MVKEHYMIEMEQSYMKVNLKMTNLKELENFIIQMVIITLANSKMV